MFLDGCTPELVTLIKMVKLALGIIQIVVPILLIVMGSLDLAKAVATQDDKEIHNITDIEIKKDAEHNIFNNKTNSTRYQVEFVSRN